MGGQTTVDNEKNLTINTVRWTLSLRFLGKTMTGSRIWCALTISFNSSVTASVLLEHAELILVRDGISAVTTTSHN